MLILIIPLYSVTLCCNYHQFSWFKTTR